MRSFAVPDPEADLDALLERALAEDVGTGDVTTRATIPPDTRATAVFLAKAGGVLAGVRVAERVLTKVDATLDVVWTAQDGASVTVGQRFGTVRGRAAAILVAERLALNLMQRMSGIATATRRMAEAARPARLLDTRKTAPGLRLLDKEAVRLGGGENHRVGLYDMILIKDNHIAACGGLTAALTAADRYRAAHHLALEIEVEVRTLAELDEALAVGSMDRLLLDNMARRQPDGTLDVSLLAEAVRRVGGRVPTEASGNVTLDTVAAIAATGVTFISSGALTHSVTALDISLDITLDA